MSTLLFVYGTLKRGCCNHGQLAGQKLIGPARTVPGYQLHDLGSYPGMIANSADCDGVAGEVWSVDAPCLLELDLFEGVPEGLYRREAILLRAPFAHEKIETFIYNQSVVGRRAIGSEWIES